MSRSRRHLQRGVNLIEIMVAMAIGLFLVLGATTLYINSKQTSDVDDSIARLQETARYALSIIESDARMANYWGQIKDASLIPEKASQVGGLNITALSGGATYDCATAYADPENYISADNNDFGLPCPENSAAVASADTLTVRRVERASVPASGTHYQICSTRQIGHLDLGGANTACPTANVEYHNLIVHGYYIDQQSDQNPNYPSLRRWALGGGAGGPDFDEAEIIPGVEDMQIEIGWDDGDDRKTAAETTRYLQPGDALLTSGGAPRGRITAVRVWLLIRAEQADATFTDNRTYTYGDRAVANGIVNDLNDADADAAAYAPNDNFRRLLVSRTIYIRNVAGNN